MTEPILIEFTTEEGLRPVGAYRRRDEITEKSHRAMEKAMDTISSMANNVQRAVERIDSSATHQEENEKVLNKCNLSISKRDIIVMINNIPFLRNKISISLALFSAAILMLLASTPLLSLINLLQPVQAQTAMSFRTPTPAEGTMSESPIEGEEATLTFDAQGTRLVTPYKLDTNGAYQITSKQDGKILASGSLPTVQGCCLANDSSTGKPIHLLGEPVGGGVLISTSCSTLATNHIDVLRLGPSAGDIAHFQGPVECSPQGGNATQQSSSSMAGSSQERDGDGDGIPDSSDKCANNSNPRCFKEAS